MASSLQMPIFAGTDRFPRVSSFSGVSVIARIIHAATGFNGQSRPAAAPLHLSPAPKSSGPAGPASAQRPTSAPAEPPRRPATGGMGPHAAAASANCIADGATRLPYFLDILQARDCFGWIQKNSAKIFPKTHEGRQ